MKKLDKEIKAKGKQDRNKQTGRQTGRVEYSIEINAKDSGWLLDVGCRFGSELHPDESKKD